MNPRRDCPLRAPSNPRGESSSKSARWPPSWSPRRRLRSPSDGKHNPAHPGSFPVSPVQPIWVDATCDHPGRGCDAPRSLPRGDNCPRCVWGHLLSQHLAITETGLTGSSGSSSPDGPSVLVGLPSGCPSLWGNPHSCPIPVPSHPPEAANVTLSGFYSRGCDSSSITICHKPEGSCTP